jgi:mannose-6-phosphate isomerase-like protein (cupin superfamily)
MRVLHSDASVPKGWHLGPWNAGLSIAIGYAHAAIDEPHLHRRITEVYLVARGTATACVSERRVYLAMGDVLVVEPGEAHTFIDSSPDYLHFVVHTPGLPAEEAHHDKVLVSREALDLGPALKKGSDT